MPRQHCWLVTICCAVALYIVGPTGGFLTIAWSVPPEFSAMTVKDTRQRLVWLRCSIGQTWNGKTCLGEPQALTLADAHHAAALAHTELEGDWRLPTKDELEGLVCQDCHGLKIDEALFPRSAPGAYWTDTPNFLHHSLHWSVNVLTGYTFGRNPPDITNYVRLVRSFSAQD